MEPQEAAERTSRGEPFHDGTAADMGGGDDRSSRSRSGSSRRRSRRSGGREDDYGEGEEDRRHRSSRRRRREEYNEDVVDGGDDGDDDSDAGDRRRRRRRSRSSSRNRRHRSSRSSRYDESDPEMQDNYHNRSRRRSSRRSRSRSPRSSRRRESYGSSRRSRSMERSPERDERRDRSERKRTRRSFFDATPQSMAHMMGGMPQQQQQQQQQFPGGPMAAPFGQGIPMPGMGPGMAINPQMLHAAIAMTNPDGQSGMLMPPQGGMHAMGAGGMRRDVSSNEDKQMRRVYVGNIPQGTTDAELLAFFNSTLREAGVIQTPGDYAVGGTMNYDRGFMFMEFRSFEEATWGMALDGIRFKGSVLKVRRPNNFTLPPGMEVDKIPHIPGIISTNVADGPNKVFIGSIAPVLEDDQVQSMLVQFGELKAFNLVRDSRTGVAKGYAFCEFADPNMTDLAIEGLNGIEIAGKRLAVQRANTNVPRQPPGGAAGAGFGGGMNIVTPIVDPNNPEGSHIANILSTQMPLQAALNALHTNIPNLNNSPTRILVLLNMVMEDELENDEDYEWISSAVQSEVKKYGSVKSVKIPRPVKESASDIETLAAEERMVKRTRNNIYSGVGKIFIEYDTVESAMQAQNALHGRKFLGRAVITSFHPEEQFANREL